jgi:hypothetical protein
VAIQTQFFMRMISGPKCADSSVPKRQCLAVVRRSLEASSFRGRIHPCV